MQHRKWRFTLKQRMGLCLAAFFAAFAMQLALNGYQSRAVQAVQDAQMGSFNAISRFQGGVESSISVLENYRWENSETDELMERLQSASSTCNAWLWRIGTSLEELENVSDEQRVLYGAVDTVYQTYTGLLEELQSDLRSGDDAAASQLYYAKILPCGDYLSQYTLQLLETAILDAQGSYTVISALNERIVLLQTVVVALCVALGCVSGLMVMRLLTPVQQMIAASRAIGRSKFDIPDIPLPKQPEIAQLAESFNIMKHSMAQQMTTLQEKNEIERELHRQKTEALELQNRMERSRLQQLRSQIDPHFLFNTLNVIQQTAGTETAYRTQALIMALSHLLRYSLMSNDEQVPLSREVRIVDEYYSIYHVRFGERVRMEWRISDLLDLTETMVPSFILQPVVENAFKHGICPKEEGGVEASIRKAMRQIEAGRRLAELAPVEPEPEADPESDAAEAGENDRNALVMAHVRKYMEDNYMFDLSLDSVSEILHISPAYLSAQFKKYQKTNFLDCLTELRINAAKELLTDPFRSAAEVASMVGYEDSSYFARTFKKRTGMTPTQYRKEAAKTIREARL